MKIVTDSAADLRPEEKDPSQVTIAPLLIRFPDGEVSAEKITPDQFYDRLRSMVPHIPTTSQPSAGDFEQIYKGLADGGHEVLSIHISSGLSGTLESARLGASMVKGAKVTPIDSMTLSGAQRFQVLAALAAVKAGWEKAAIIERLNKIRASTELVYTLETLEYLARGGRIGRVQALAGSLLKLKPVIKVDKKDGKYTTVGKNRTLEASLKSISDHLAQAYPEKTPLWISVMHGQFVEYANILADMLSQKLQIAKIEILRISPVLGVHTGPGIVGVAALPIALFDGLI